MAQNTSNKNKISKTKVTEDVSSGVSTKRRQNNLRSSQLSSIPNRSQTPVSSGGHLRSRNINQSSSVQEGHYNLKSASCVTACVKRIVSPSVPSYKNSSSLDDSDCHTEVPEQEVSLDKQNSHIPISTANHEEKMIYCNNCLLNDIVLSSQKEEGHVETYQVLNKNIISKNNAVNDPSSREIRTQHNVRNPPCCRGSNLHKKACDSKSLRSKNEPQCHLKNEHRGKLQSNKLRLISSAPIPVMSNISTLETTDVEEGTAQSSSHMSSVVPKARPSENSILKTDANDLRDIKQKTTSVQYFNNQQKSNSDVETSNNYMGSQSELHVSEERVPSVAAQRLLKQSGVSSPTSEIQRKSNKIREIQQMLQLEKCSDIKENEQALHSSQNRSKNLKQVNTLLKQEKPYRQWHRISRIVAVESNFIISHRTSSEVSSDPKKSALCSERGVKPTANDACAESESRSAGNKDPSVENTNQSTNSSSSKPQGSRSKIRNRSSSNKLRSNTYVRGDIQQLKDAEITQKESVLKSDEEELPALLHTCITLNHESVLSRNPDLCRTDENALIEMSHQDDAFAMDNKEHSKIFVANNHRKITVKDFEDLSYVGSKENSITVLNKTCKIPKVWNSLDAVGTAELQTTKQQLPANENPHLMFFSSRARSKSLKSFCISKRQNRRKQKQCVDEKYPIRDHSADCIYHQGDITGCYKPRNLVSRVSHITGPSFYLKKRCKDYADYLKMTPSLVQVPEIKTERRASNVGKATGQIHDTVNSDSAGNNATNVVLHQRSGSLRKPDEMSEITTPKYRESTIPNRHSERERGRRNSCHQTRSVCQTTRSKKLHSSEERQKHKQPRLPASKSTLHFPSDLSSKVAPHVDRKRNRTHRVEPAQKYADFQATADCKGASPKQLNFVKC